jgi:hypothetical protein
MMIQSEVAHHVPPSSPLRLPQFKGKGGRLMAFSILKVFKRSS